jgi:hypothetical protein
MAVRTAGPRQPNQRLAALIQEAASSNAGLARRVNMVGAEHGLDLRYDKTSVARWLRGQQPRGMAPTLIAEALGRKLGRPVTVEEIGMADGRNGSSSVGLHFAPSTTAAIEEVTELWRADVSHREFLLGSSFAVAALIAPSRDWLITPPDAEVARPPSLAGRGPRIGPSDVYALRAAAKVFRDLDHQFGSGYVRSIVVHYLDDVVAEMLMGTYPERTGRALFSAAAQITELAGYMAVDTGRHGLAQRYYIQALRLSQAAGDRAYGGYVLAAGMSHLAGQLGSPREITQLARAASEGARDQATPTVRAMFHAAEARGHAVLGDVRSCEAALARAAAEMEKSNPQEDPDWIRHFTPAYLSDEFAHCYRDLDRPRQAKDHAQRALAEHAPGHVRRRVVDTVLVATAYAQEREVEAACATGSQAIEMLSQLRSHRGIEYLHDLDRRLDPYQDSSAVRGFRERLGRLAVRQSALPLVLAPAIPR